MGKKVYFSDEMNAAWQAAWKAGKNESKLRNHRGTTSKDVTKNMLSVCLDFQDQGVLSIEGE